VKADVLKPRCVIMCMNLMNASLPAWLCCRRAAIPNQEYWSRSKGVLGKIVMLFCKSVKKKKVKKKIKTE